MLTSRSSRSSPGTRPRLDRADRWLYDRYTLGCWTGGESGKPSSKAGNFQSRLREAAHDFAGALLTGQLGGLSGKAIWIMLGVDCCLIAAVLAVAVATDNYQLLSGVIIGVPLMVLAVRSVRRTRQRMDRVHRLNG